MLFRSTILRDLINSGLPMRLQLEATESLGETADPTRARAALRQIATTHPRDAVRGKAYETLANLSER